MIFYKISQWILIFFIYSFLGWVWESTYKSLQQRKLVNRGYLSGPWVPIYGFGALLILFTTLPFKQNQPMIFLVGMVCASIFEFLVGYGMEKILHARYWDYSRIPLNIQGYIALPVSILWGFFSLFLVNVIDMPISHFVYRIPIHLVIVIDVILVIIFLTDFILSTIQALDLKKVLKQHIEDLKLNEKNMLKAQKIYKRNPNILSKRYKLDKKAIKEIFNDKSEN